MQMTFLAFVLFTASFTFIGLLSAPRSKDDSSAVDPYLQITYLPFYSSAAVFTFLNFIVYGTVMAIRNCIKYMRYGVTTENDYYSQH